MIFLRIVGRVFLRFFKKQCLTHSATIAYYMVLSFFPAVLILIIIGSKTVSNSELLIKEMVFYINTLIPATSEAIVSQIYYLAQHAGIFAYISVAILIWASASVFSTIDVILNNIFDFKAQRTFITSQLAGIVMMFAMYGLLFASIIISFSFEVIKSLSQVFWFTGRGADILIGFVRATGLVPAVLILAMFYFVFRYLPKHKVPNIGALAGALTTSVLFEVSKKIFLWFLFSRAKEYQLIYGSLASAVFFLLWCYIFAALILLGACVAFEIDILLQKKRIQDAACKT